MATLIPEGKDGHFKESFSPYAPSVDYTIILMGERNGDHYSVEYDCSTNFTGTNYCIHILAREPTMQTETLDYLLDTVNQMELN